jgi:hypothetical protein
MRKRGETFSARWTSVHAFQSPNDHHDQVAVRVDVSCVQDAIFHFSASLDFLQNAQCYLDRKELCRFAANVKRGVEDDVPETSINKEKKNSKRMEK